MSYDKVTVIEDEGEFIVFCRDSKPIGDAQCVNEYQMAELYETLEADRDRLAAEVKQLRERVDRLAEALNTMIDQEVSYMKINNLGNPEEQHGVIFGREALAEWRKP